MNKVLCEIAAEGYVPLSQNSQRALKKKNIGEGDGEATRSFSVSKSKLLASWNKALHILSLVDGERKRDVSWVSVKIAQAACSCGWARGLLSSGDGWVDTVH